MRRVVAEYLEPRLCRDAVSVVLTVVPANDAIALLRAGMVWSVQYDHGRLLAELSSWDLLAGGHVELGLAQRCLGRALSEADLAEIEARASTDSHHRQLRELRAILASPSGVHRTPLTDEPIRALDEDPTDGRSIDLYDYVEMPTTLPPTARRLPRCSRNRV
jgi:hypothetical protein